MKKIIAATIMIFAIIGCQSNGVEKPDDLIDKDKMVDILYDISILENVNQNVNWGNSIPSKTDYIYKKYKIDSIQFVKSNIYYASDVEEYRKMLDEIKERLKIEEQKVKSTAE